MGDRRQGKEDLIRAVMPYVELVTAALRNPGQAEQIPRMAGKLWAAMLAIKDEAFKEENEWRIVGTGLPISYRPGRFGILPYMAVPLCKPPDCPTLTRIYVGPNENPIAAAKAVREFVNARIAPSSRSTLEVVDSQVPYRY